MAPNWPQPFELATPVRLFRQGLTTPINGA